MRDLDVRDRFRREAELRARIPFLTLKRPLLPAPEIMLLLDTRGRIVRRSDRHAGERLNNIPLHEGVDVHRAFHPKCAAEDCDFLEDWRRAWMGHRSGLPVEWLYLADDSDFVAKLRLQPVSYMCGVLFAGSIDDFAAHSVLYVQDLSKPNRGEEESAADAHLRNAYLYERRRTTDGDPNLVASLDERLRRVTRRLINAQDLVRKQLAAELHDSLGQTLSLLRLEIESIAARQESDQGSGPLARTVDYVRRAQRELRQITNELHTGTASASGLTESLESLVSDFRNARPEIDLVANVPHFEPNAPEDLAVTIYRIVQEAFNNIIQHSQATAAALTLATENDGVQLEIRDNGKGLPDTPAERRGLGLITMRERAETVGGKYDISGAPNEGCTVRVTWSPDVIASLR